VKSACCEESHNCSLRLLLARLFLGGGYFLWSAAAIFLAWKSVRLFIASYGFDLHAGLLAFIGAIYFLIAVMVLSGYWIRTACAVAFCLSLPFLFFRLSFWGTAGFQAMVAQNLFMTTAAIMGGLSLLMLTGAGNYSLRSKERDWSESPTFRSWGLLLARILIGGCFFIWSAIWKLTDWHTQITILQAWKIPLPNVVLIAMFAIELIGGLMILVGYRHRIAAWILAAYVALVAVVLHPFWAVSAPDEPIDIGDGGVAGIFINHVFVLDRLLQAKLFMDSLGIIAALLVLTTCISGRYGFEKKRGSQ